MLALLSGAALADDFVGQASVIDGDTLEIHGTRNPLWSIDAPESSQLCRGEDSLQYRCGVRRSRTAFQAEYEGSIPFTRSIPQQLSQAILATY